MVWMKQCRPANLSIVLGLAFVLLLVYYTLLTEIDAARIERVSLRLLLRTSILAAIRGGNEVVRAQRENLNIRSKGLNQLGTDDLLTDGDIRSHRVMLKTLLKIFPRLKVVSEEHEDEKSPSPPPVVELEEVNLPESISNFIDESVRLHDILVWIDPLDATQEYSEGLTEFVTTMVCIAVNGHSRIGVIHQPFANRTVWAWVGQGPSKSLRGVQDDDDDDDDDNNTDRINSNSNNNNNINSNINNNNNNNNNKNNNNSHNNNNNNNSHKNNKNNSPTNAESEKIEIVVSRSHAGKVKQFAQENLNGDTIVTPAGGAGYKVLQVAEGRADLYIHTTLIKKWDICAGSALLEALGGQMVTLKGESIDFGSPQSVKNADGVLAFQKDKHNFMKLTRSQPPN